MLRTAASSVVGCGQPNDVCEGHLVQGLLGRFWLGPVGCLDQLVDRTGELRVSDHLVDLRCVEAHAIARAHRLPAGRPLAKSPVATAQPHLQEVDRLSTFAGACGDEPVLRRSADRTGVLRRGSRLGSLVRVRRCWVPRRLGSGRCGCRGVESCLQPRGDLLVGYGYVVREQPLLDVPHLGRGWISQDIPKQDVQLLRCQP